MKAFYDTTVGNNTVVEFDADNNPVTAQGFNALTSRDATTGWGTPDACELVRDLVKFLKHG